MKSITPYIRIGLLSILLIACSKDKDRYDTVNGSNRARLVTGEGLSEGIQNISEFHSMNFKANAAFGYEYQALAAPPALEHNQTSATCIIREGNLVYIGWHTHDPANYNGFAKYSGAVSCYEVTNGNWTLINRVDFNQMDIHEMALGANSELFIVGQSNPDVSGYDLDNGHRGAIIGRVPLDVNGYPTSVGYIERPLVSFGANSVHYEGANEIYAGTGNANGYLYKLDDALQVLDSSRLGNVKSVSRNNASNKLGILKGNRGNGNIDAKHYEFNVGAGTLPDNTGGTVITGLTTVRFERNEGGYYGDYFLATGNEGLFEIDPAGPTVSQVYNANRTLSVAADEVNEVLYVAAEDAGLTVLHGSGTANEYQVIGSFAPLSLNSGNWYVSDVVHDGNNVFLTSGSRNVIFTKIYPDYYSNSNATKLLYLRGGDPAGWTVPFSPGGQSIAISEWQAEGFTVTTMDFDSTITESLLRDYGVVVIDGYFNEGRGTDVYPASEGTALYNWVNAGGRLLGLATFAEQNHLYSPFGVDQVGRNSHLTIGLQAYFGNPLFIPGFTDFSGGGAYVMNAEHMDVAVLNGLSPLSPMAPIGIDPALAFGQVGDGKVVISFAEGWMQDASFPANIWQADINDADNLTILRNIIQYLK